MSHARQHSGWATAAKRRGEELRACNTCGHTHIGRSTYPVPEVDDRISPLGLLGMVATLLLCFGAVLYGLPIIFQAVSR